MLLFSKLPRSTSSILRSDVGCFATLKFISGVDFQHRLPSLIRKKRRIFPRINADLYPLLPSLIEPGRSFKTVRCMAVTGSVPRRSGSASTLPSSAVLTAKSTSLSTDPTTASLAISKKGRAEVAHHDNLPTLLFFRILSYISTVY